MTGQNISNAARLNNSELAALTLPKISQRPLIGDFNATDVQTMDAGHHLEQCLSAVKDMQFRGLEDALRQAAVDLPKITLLTDVISKMFEIIGRLWAEGSLRILHEHLATNVTQGFLWDMLRCAAPDSASSSMVVATPAGQWCQIGALIAAVAASDAGLDVNYFGPNLPAEEIAAAAKGKRARYVALSISYVGDQGLIVRELTRLKEGLPPDTDIIVGGRGAHACTRAIKRIGAVEFQHVRELLDMLNAS